MNKELIVQMQSQFDALAQTHPEAADLEFWFADRGIEANEIDLDVSKQQKGAVEFFLQLGT